ncbi:chorismate lyase [Legionella sp. 16cNR16C]|uniref:chorismate--pyruvate lyase family protein n=1 Tax=Legionella sp. 16cNR16C TaxID=2905656 RepID=UPI001E48FB50|nr:chorismate lyase [Legionella sp. 16cNR16C]MCE3043907.1 chorismate lyase [Legionella sp. 16cNR16C]
MQTLLPPAEWATWLTHKAALTEKLRQETGDARLELIQQVMTKRNWWDRFFLGISEESVIHRDVMMFSGNQCCWFARSVIPESTFEQNNSFFNRLQKESLGQIVFNSPNVERVSLSHYSIDNNFQEYYWIKEELIRNASKLWVRYSRFIINGHFPFYLIEILLPDLSRIKK